MYGFLLALLVLDGILLGVVILLQAGKGGGLAAMGGGAAATDVLGGRQATTLLTRATWILGSAFMVLSLVLAILSSRSEGPDLVLEGIGAGAVAPQPLLPEGSTVTDLLPSDGEQNPPDEDPPGEEGSPEVEDPPEERSPPGDGSHPGGEGTPPGS